MIHIKRDPSLIPAELIQQAQETQRELERLPENERSEFIKSKSAIWRAFRQYLEVMSHRKCWYSESNDPQAFFDVDHFRPKNEAKRAEDQADDGYPWLAFAWENFRYAAQRSNRRSTDEDTEEVVGKGSWFPLVDGSPLATWDNRCVGDEQPVLLDPTNQDDVDLIDVAENGYVVPSRFCVGAVKAYRVEKSVELYGLNLPRIVEERARTMREVKDLAANLDDIIGAGADMMAVTRLIASLREKVSPRAAFSRAAKKQIISSNVASLLQ